MSAATLQQTACPASPEALAAELAAAGAAGRAVLPAGLGLRGGPGAPPARADLVLSTRALSGLTALQPGDQVVSARAGTPLEHLQAELAAHGLWLPVSPRPGSLGGLLATGEDGPLDLAHGRVRERVLGATVALADGTLASGRGRVVKNVAGYDLPRLLVGSLGTLGVLVEATLRVQPRPAARTTLALALPGWEAALEAAQRLAPGPLEPAAADLHGAPGAGPVTLVLVFEGSPEGVRRRADAARAALAGLGATDSDPPPADEAAVSVRVDGEAARLPALLAALAALPVPPRARLRPALDLAFLDWPQAPPPAAFRAALAAARACGSAVPWRAPAGLVRTTDDAWGPPPPDLPLMRRVKQALDPAGVLAAGRFVGGL